MRLLICTQAVDLDDPVLGFFHAWIAALAREFGTITVLCLSEGRHDLPSNVRVRSLGKNEGLSRGGYLIRFFRYAWSLRREYDAVFVHMNEEYVLLGSPLWLALRKRVYLWRNHYAGSWRTKAAARLCRNVFYTSVHSYTARFKNAIEMPIGIDTSIFKARQETRQPHSILFLARMAPSKRPNVLLESLAQLAQRGIAFTASFYGNPAKGDEAFYGKLQQRVRDLHLGERIRFHPGIANRETPALYGAYGIFVNISPAGMLDKTIGEAMASGCLVVASNEAVRDILGDLFVETVDAAHVAAALEKALACTEEEREKRRRAFAEYVRREHSLPLLAERLSKTMSH
jgi:glycosyltransferase involved in cell wall biosynthesis